MINALPLLTAPPKSHLHPHNCCAGMLRDTRTSGVGCAIGEANEDLTAADPASINNVSVTPALPLLTRNFSTPFIAHIANVRTSPPPQISHRRASVSLPAIAPQASMMSVYVPVHEHPHNWNWLHNQDAWNQLSEDRRQRRKWQHLPMRHIPQKLQEQWQKQQGTRQAARKVAQVGVSVFRQFVTNQNAWNSMSCLRTSITAYSALKQPQHVQAHTVSNHHCSAVHALQVARLSLEQLEPLNKSAYCSMKGLPWVPPLHTHSQHNTQASHVATTFYPSKPPPQIAVEGNLHRRKQQQMGKFQEQHLLSMLTPRLSDPPQPERPVTRQPKKQVRRACKVVVCTVSFLRL